MLEEELGTRLTSSLLNVARDPGMLGALHGLLGGYCHQARNILNCLKMSLYLAKRAGCPDASAALRKLEARYRSIERFYDELQAICRPMPLSPIRLPLGLLIDERRREWDAWMSGAGRRLVFDPPAEPAIGFYDPNRLTQGLDGLVGWRARSGEPGTSARLRWRADAGMIELEWDEDRAPARIRGRGAADTDEATSLALPLLARIAVAHGGRLDVSTGRGLQLAIRWPVEVPQPCESGPC